MAEPQSSRRPRIIVAEDHEWIRNILVQVVAQTLPAAEVVATENGLEAFQVYQQGGADFLITNHQMPGMDGMTLVRQTREQAPALPIVMVSVNPETEADALAAGASWFLSKDKIMEHLPKLLRQNVVSRRGPLDEGSQAE